LTQEKEQKKHGLKYLSILFFEEKYQKNLGLKYFAINSAPFHCSGKTHCVQTVSLTAISLR
jgi:hypothetical protein